MEPLLKEASVIRSVKRGADEDIELLRESRSNDGNAKSKQQQHQKAPTTPKEALDVLRQEPDYDSLISVLNFLSRHETDGSPFIKLPGPLSAQLVQVLVSQIVPNYWALLVEDAHQSKTSGMRLLLYCLSSSTGMNAIMIALGSLVQDAKSETAAGTKRPDLSLNLGIMLDLLCRVLQGDGWLLEAYRLATAGQEPPAKVKPKVQAIVGQFGGGRIVSMAAEAEDILRKSPSSKSVENIWPASSLEYSQWLGRNIVKVVVSDQNPDAAKFASDLLAKALHLGHFGKTSLSLHTDDSLDARD